MSIETRRAITVPLAFGATIGLSAFLLFSVEPLVGRLVLPVFGGTPAVWATVLFFFQGVLLLGYLYAHLSVERLGPRRGVALHVPLVIVAVVALALAPTRLADLRVAEAPAVLNLVGILVVAVGLPSFVMTSTTPLVSAWFATVRAQRSEEPDPYWLYALSNAGSFAALIVYPLIIEPRLGLTAQRWAWIGGLAVLAALLAVCGAFVVRARRTAERRERSSEPAPAAPLVGQIRADPVSAGPIDETDAANDRLGPITWRRRLGWLLIAAVPSGLLTAVTNFITTDLISAPLLWVGPLAIYLLSFVVAFSARGRRLVPLAGRLSPAAVTLLWVPFGSAAGWPILPLVALELLGFAVVATALHGRLALDRPEPARLTEFYLVVSAGGVLASACVALLAPVIFDGIWEYPILLVAALVALVGGVTLRRQPPSRDPSRRPGGLNFAPFFTGFRWRVLPYLAAVLLLVIALEADRSIATEASRRWILVGGIVLAFGSRPSFLVIMTGLVLALAVFVLSPAAVFRDRSFFGVTEVLLPAEGDRLILMNGTTIHGIQTIDPAKRLVPISYYIRSGPVGDLFAAFNETVNREGRSIGVVGLGAGTLSVFAEPTDALTFYEIDPLVAEVASDPRYFTFLSESPTQPSIVLGDARLSLEAIEDDSHDLIIMDAFSSDAIPAHLLTVEAIRDDVRVLRRGGILAVHISNRYYDLGPPIAVAGRSAGLTMLEKIYSPTDADIAAGAAPSHWLVGLTDPAAARSFANRGWRALQSDVTPLTDDYPNLLRFLTWGQEGRPVATSRQPGSNNRRLAR
jgi:hypothetical protein